MATKPVRVLLVDDSPLALVVLQRMLSTSPEIEVVGVATHGRQALELIPHLKPSIVCTDYHMPDMNGLELIREIMGRFPCPILVVSSAVGSTDADRIFSLLEAGAVDIFPKPRGGPDAGAIAAEQLVKKIKIVAGVRVHGRRPKTGHIVPISGLATKPFASTPRIVAIGASTGGPQALQTILSELPRDFPVPILCVQHISLGFLPGLVSWLAAHCQMSVRIARANEPPCPGHVYFPPENSHLIVDVHGKLQASSEAFYGGHRPSATVTFRSVANRYGGAAAGVLLTGMGHDGGEGMLTLFQAGALTICQDEATSVVYGMPKDAVERGAARFVLPLPDIAGSLMAAVTPAEPNSTSTKTNHGKN